MASELRVTTIANNAGSESVDTTYVVNGSIKSWAGGVNHTNQSYEEAFNVSSYTDNGVGRADLTLTSNMSTSTYSVTHGSQLQYPYQARSSSTSVWHLASVNSSAGYNDGECNGMVVGDLA